MSLPRYSSERALEGIRTFREHGGLYLSHHRCGTLGCRGPCVADRSDADEKLRRNTYDRSAHAALWRGRRGRPASRATRLRGHGVSLASLGKDRLRKYWRTIQQTVFFRRRLYHARGAAVLVDMSRLSRRRVEMDSPLADGSRLCTALEVQ